MSVLIETLVKIFSVLLAYPPIRIFLEDVVEKEVALIAADVFTRSDKDPAFKETYLSISQKLAQATDPKEKKAYVDQLRALRSAPAA